MMQPQSQQRFWVGKCISHNMTGGGAKDYDNGSGGGGRIYLDKPAA